MAAPTQVIGAEVPRTQLNLPRAARVRVAPGGAPALVDGHAIELVRESWLVEDRRWTVQPLRRRYWEVVSSSGRNMVVFHDLGSATPGGDAGRRGAGGWFVQRS
jgi:hypothetical protein